MFPFKMHFQTLKHAPQNGVNGNCQQTVIACLLNKEIDEVPHFAEGLDFSQVKESGEIFSKRVADYLASQGLQEFLLAYEGMSLEDVMKVTSGQNPKIPMIVGVQGSRGINHSVIAYNGGIVHDPHGPVELHYEPLNCGHTEQYQVSILVPIQLGMNKDEQTIAGRNERLNKQAEAMRQAVLDDAKQIAENEFMKRKDTALLTGLSVPESLIDNDPEQFLRLCSKTKFMLLRNSAWSRIIGSREMVEFLIPVTTTEIVLKGSLGTINGCEVYTDAFLEPRLRTQEIEFENTIHFAGLRDEVNYDA